MTVIGEVDSFPKTQWIEWKIKDFSLSEIEDKPYSSPLFSLHGESWNLITYINTLDSSDSSDYNDSLYLIRNSGESPINVDISVALKTVNGEKHLERHVTKVFEPNISSVLVIPGFTSKPELVKRWSELVHNDTLTFICTMTILPSTGNEGTNATCLLSPSLAETSRTNVPNVSEDTHCNFSTLHETPEKLGEEIVESLHETFVNNSVLPLKSSTKKKKRTKSIRHFPLPEFSKSVRPLLDGEVLTEKNHAELSSLLKEELISFLNRENLICSGNTSNLRWKYRDLGEALARKYPKILWDLPSKRQKRFQKQNAPFYAVFIHRLSQRRKMQRLRQKVKGGKEFQFSTNVANDAFNVSHVNAVSELKNIPFEEKCIVCTKEASAACQQCAKVFFCSSKCGRKYWEDGHKDACVK